MSATNAQGQTAKNRLQEAADLSDIRDDLAALKSDVAELFGGVTTTGKQVAREGMSSAFQRASDALHCSKDSARRAHQQVEKTVTMHPLSSLAIAFAVGALIGRVLRR